jgi:hypothetical protein
MILDGVCTQELSSVLAVVRWIVNLVKLAVPILLVVLATFDLAKVVTNSKGDDSETKKAVKTLITRIIYGLIIYFVPIIIVWLFTSIRIGGVSEVMDCYNNASLQQL